MFECSMREQKVRTSIWYHRKIRKRIEPTAKCHTDKAELQAAVQTVQPELGRQFNWNWFRSHAIHRTCNARFVYFININQLYRLLIEMVPFPSPIDSFHNLLSLSHAICFALHSIGCNADGVARSMQCRAWRMDRFLFINLPIHLDVGRIRGNDCKKNDNNYFIVH